MKRPRRRRRPTVVVSRFELDELRRRLVDYSGLGRPVPSVSTEVAQLLVDLWVALERCVAELERAG